jgi:hypothetical protein
MAFVNLPPNFQDMFYSITDRIAKLETGPNQAMYTAEAAQGSSAQATAEAAQALTQAQAANALGVQALAEADIAIAQGTQAIQTANAALVTANAAYVLGAQSLQKSADTITNASNQITAINGNGITVYSGASSSSGARVVLNSAGLAGYNSGGTATFSILASTGAVSTNGAIFTSSTITGGSLNINGNAIINSSGYLTAVGATITGNITATSGTFTGVVNATSGTFTGTITSSNATITGGSLNVGGNFIVTSAGVLTATGVNITGAITATSGSFTGSITSTSGSIGGFTLSASSIYSSTNLVIETSGQISGGNSSTIFYGYANIGGGAATGQRLIVAGDSSFNGKISTITSSFVGQMNYSGIATGSGSTMVVVATGSRVAYTTSSERFKEQIKYINTTGWLDKVLQMKPITYKTSEDFTVEGEPNETQIGFLAEDIYDIGGDLEKAVVLDPLGDPFSLSYDRLTVFLTLGIKEIDARLKILEGN